MTFLSIPSLVNKKILGLCCNCRQWWGGIDGETFPVLAKTYFQWKLYFPWKTRLGVIFALNSCGPKAQFNLQFLKLIPYDNEAIPCVPALLWLQGFPGALASPSQRWGWRCCQSVPRHSNLFLQLCCIVVNIWSAVGHGRVTFPDTSTWVVAPRVPECWTCCPLLAEVEHCAD